MEEINLKDLFVYFISKLQIVIIATFVMIIGSCIYALCIQKPLYSSYTTIVLARSGEEGNEVGITQSDITLNQKLVPTYRAIMKSRRILNQVIKNLDLDYSVGALSGRINVASEKDTELIKISVSDHDSKTAKKIADEIAKVFAKEIVEIYNIQNVSVIDYAAEAVNPYNVNIIKQTVIAAFIGLVLSCGAIFIMFYFDTTIKSVDEVERKIGLPILGSIPKSNYAKVANNSKSVSNSKGGKKK